MKLMTTRSPRAKARAEVMSEAFASGSRQLHGVHHWLSLRFALSEYQCFIGRSQQICAPNSASTT